MKDFFKKFKYYIKMPEMKILWLFLFLMILILVIDLIYLELLWTIISLLILSLVGVIVFLTSIRAAQSNRNLLLEKKRLGDIISSMSDAIILYDQEFKVLIFNNAAEAIFNIPATDIIGRNLSPECIRNQQLTILTKVIFQSLAPTVIRQSPEGVYPQVVDITFEEPHLEFRVITDRAMDENGQIAGFLKIVRDRTREIEIIKSKNDFIALAAHQLRTPLSAVGWVFESLKAEPLNENQKELVATGSAAAKKLSGIVEDLLKVSKIEEGRFGYNFQKIDLVKFLQAILDQAAVVAREYNVKIFMEPPPEPSMLIEADPEKLGQAVSNLLENAIRYNVQNGQVIISAERRSDAPFVQVNIADTGLGIPQEAMDKLFTKFFRAENIKTKETEGSGLGLYITRNVIKRHGGQIWAESEVGRGSIFHFTLPTDPRLIPQKEVAYGEAQ